MPASPGLQMAEAHVHCRAYPDAFVLRCFAFEPSDAQVGMNSGDMPHLMMFPPTLSGAHDEL